ncbi:DUF2786 domain-containing protein [Facklamia miroungae]|uniref:Uncharacterized protein n=1 Tax=Facklamia miroungae TaxID=120956 RepID=A0A1G7P9W2_9LACT|nr:DUF2786 domain-containing protein [Facklamia miroungae]NKZ28635.1 DUF2786 domain-containing protein [Facklamia miroungae]SDF83092.1 Protein of unknown function [Facklamia miroungae]
MSETNQKILAKIRNLLSLAEDGGNDEESQTALLMAQKLMLKHRISQQEVSDKERPEIILRSLSVYKRLYWWEKVLVKIIADNFRCMFYIQSNRLPHQQSVQRKIVLMGFPEDVDLCFQMFNIAADTMKYYSKLHLTQLSAEELRQSSLSQLRKSYYQGFMDGLKEKFDLQLKSMMKENEKYALIIQTPQSVKEKFNREITGLLTFNQPTLSRSNHAYEDGFQKGKNVNLSQGQLDHQSDSSQ